MKDRYFGQLGQMTVNKGKEKVSLSKSVTSSHDEIFFSILPEHLIMDLMDIIK